MESLSSRSWTGLPTPTISNGTWSRTQTGYSPGDYTSFRTAINSITSTAPPTPTSYVWTSASSTAWSTGSNWDGGVAPSPGLAGYSVTAGSAGTQGSLVLSGSTTLGQLTLSGGTAVTISPTSATLGSLIFDNGGLAAASLTVNHTAGLGTHTNVISAPVMLNNNVDVAVTNARDRLDLSGPIQGAGGLLLSASNLGTVVLSGSNTYSGGTTVEAGLLVAGAAHALYASSPVTISGGTLDASGFAGTVQSLTITSGGLDLGLGNTLTCSGTADLAGNLNVSGAGSLGNYRLLAYQSRMSAFTSTTGLNSNYGLLYKATELDALHKAQVGNLTLTAANPTVITGGKTALTIKLCNSAPILSDTLKFTACVGGKGYGLCTSGSLAATCCGSFSIANGFNSSGLAAGSYKGTVKVTGSNSALSGSGAQQRRYQERCCYRP